MGSATGMLATQSSKAGEFLEKYKMKKLNKFRKSGLGAAAIPIAMGTSGYVAGKKATGQKMDNKAKAAILSLAGGAASASLYDKFKRGHTNHFKRGGAASLGATIGGMGAVAYMKKKREKELKKTASKIKTIKKIVEKSDGFDVDGAMKALLSNNKRGKTSNDVVNRVFANIDKKGLYNNG
jgi:hypothetical protein